METTLAQLEVVPPRGRRGLGRRRSQGGRGKWCKPGRGLHNINGVAMAGLSGGDCEYFITLDLYILIIFIDSDLVTFYTSVNIL